MKKVEFIESYVKCGNDYQWNDNHGELIRCKDCMHNVANKKKDPLDTTDYSGADIVCDYFMTDGQEPEDFCSHAKRGPVTHLEPMHLYPKEKERLEAVQLQGFGVVTCNNWLCPFNNDGYCVSPGHGDECTIYGDEDFKKYLDDVYNESFSLDLRELTRQLMIMKWGRENDDTKRD